MYEPRASTRCYPRLEFRTKESRSLDLEALKEFSIQYGYRTLENSTVVREKGFEPS